MFQNKSISKKANYLVNAAEEPRRFERSSRVGDYGFRIEMEELVVQEWDV